MDITYNNNEAKKLYQELKSIRKEFKPTTILIKDKYVNTVSNKVKVLQFGLNIMRTT
jgi:ABC-type branched-subunit amino acid transport system ATPase component